MVRWAKKFNKDFILFYFLKNLLKFQINNKTNFLSTAYGHQQRANKIKILGAGGQSYLHESSYVIIEYLLIGPEDFVENVDSHPNRCRTI